MRPLAALFVSLLAILTAAPAPAEYAQDWAVHWDGSGGDDQAVEVIADGSGAVYVLGRAHNGSDRDYVVLKYDGSTHALLWERVFDRGDEDTARDMDVGGGGVYVTGESWNGSDWDYLTLRLDATDGSVDWQKVYDDGKDDEGWGVAYDNGHVYVTGESKQFVYDDAVTIRYDASSGSRDWVRSHSDGLNNYASAIAVDTAGDVYVVGGTGRSLNGMNYLTVKYSPSGTEQWAELRDGAGSVENDPDLAWDVAVSGTTVYVTGQMNGYLEKLNYGTVAYRTSDGYERWCSMYDGPAGEDDKAHALAVAADGSVWVTGVVVNDVSWGQSCIATVKYSSAGSELCVDVESSGMPYVTEHGYDIAAASSGDVWMTGTVNSSMHDYEMLLERYGGACSGEWADVYDRSGGTDEGRGVAVDGDVVYVAATTRNGSDDITLARYSDQPVVQTITAGEPNDGEHWYVGTEHQITWTSENIPSVTLEYTTEWGDPSPTWHTIVASTPSDGSFMWEVPLPANEPSDDCRIRVSDAADGDPSDVTTASFEIYRFLVTRDGYGFSNTTQHGDIDTNPMWPSDCWPDYGGYPYTEWSHFDWEDVTDVLVDAWAAVNGEGPFPPGAAYPSWPMFVHSFGENQCYLNAPPGDVVFRPSAVRYWFMLPKFHYGSCIGFALTTNMVFDGLVPLSSYFPGYSELYDVPIGDCSDGSGRMTVNNNFTDMWGAQHVAYQGARLLDTTPTETLNEIRTMLGDEERNHRVLAMWANNGAVAHYLVPTRVQQDATDPDLWYVYTAENFYAGVDTCHYEIDTGEDTWVYYADGFPTGSFSNQGRGLFLMDDMATYLSTPLLPFNHGGQLEVMTGPTAYATFTPLGRTRSIADPVSLNTAVGPVGLSDGMWACQFDSLVSGRFSWTLFTDDDVAYTFERDGAVENETDAMRYDDATSTVTVLNPGASSRVHSIEGIKTGSSSESVVTVEGLAVDPGDSLRYRVLSDGRLRVDNYGAPQAYDLSAMTCDVYGTDPFLHGGVEIDGTTRHTIGLDWSTRDGELSIEVDNGIDGSVDGVLWVGNQLDWSDVPDDAPPRGFVARARSNPFASRTTIEYYLPARGDVAVEIFDPAGRRVDLLEDTVREAGWHSLTWHPADVSSGVYFCRVRAGGEERTIKLVRLR